MNMQVDNNQNIKPTGYKAPTGKNSFLNSSSIFDSKNVKDQVFLSQMIKKGEENYNNSFEGRIKNWGKEVIDNYNNVAHKYNNWRSTLSWGQKIGYAAIGAALPVGIIAAVAISPIAGVIAGAVILTGVGCSRDEKVLGSRSEITGTESAGLDPWGGAAITDVSENEATITLHPDSGVSFNLTGLKRNLSAAGLSLPSKLYLDGAKLGTVTNNFSVGIMDARAKEISEAAAREDRAMTAAEQAEFDTHVKYVNYEINPVTGYSFVGSAGNPLAIDLDPTVIKSPKNYFDHTKNYIEPASSFTNLEIDADGITIKTKTDNSGTGTLGAMNEDGWSLSGISGQVFVSSLGAGQAYYIVEDVYGNKETAMLPGANGTYTIAESSFSPNTNIIRNANVLSYDLSGDGAIFTMANEGYLAIDQGAGGVFSISDADVVSFNLSNFTASQLAGTTILIQDADGNSMAYAGPVNGANSLFVSDFAEKARVSHVNSLVVRGANSYTADIFLKGTAGSAADFYFNTSITPNSSTKYRFVLTIPSSVDPACLQNFDFKTFNGSGESQSLSFLTPLDICVTSRQNMDNGKVQVTIEVPQSYLTGSNIGNVAYISLSNKIVTSDISFSFANLQVDINGSGLYTERSPLMIDRSKIQKIAVYNDSGETISNGTFTGVSIGGTNFSSAKDPEVDWTKITKIMFGVSGATANTEMDFQLLGAGFTPFEFGSDWISGTDPEVVTISSAEETDTFSLGVRFVGANGTTLYPYTIFPTVQH